MTRMELVLGRATMQLHPLGGVILSWRVSIQPGVGTQEVEPVRSRTLTVLSPYDICGTGLPNRKTPIPGSVTLSVQCTLTLLQSCPHP